MSGKSTSPQSLLSCRIESYALEGGITPARVAAAHLALRQWQVEQAQSSFPDIHSSQAELLALPGSYTAEGGNFLLARGGEGELLGMVGLRALGGGEGVVKRLAVLPEYQRRGVGEALVCGLLEWAEQQGSFSLLSLKTGRREHALPLSQRLGFRLVSPFPHQPGWVEGIDWSMELRLPRDR